LAGGMIEGSTFWDREFIDLLVTGGRYVIRFDARDASRSSWVDFEKHPYNLVDLAGDLVAILDAYGIGKAHLVGVSAGAMLGQQSAIDHPDRLASLTSISSTVARLTDADTENGAWSWEDMEPMTPEAAEAIRADFARRHNLPEDVRGHPNRAPNRVR